MLTAKKSAPKPKKVTSTKNLSSKSKPLKELKVDKNIREMELNRRTLSINQTSVDTFKQSKGLNAVTCPHKGENVYNPYFQLFSKCQRTISNAEYQLSKYKNKERETNSVMKKNKEKNKNTTFSPEDKTTNTTSRKGMKKKQRTSRSVDNINRIQIKRVDYRSNSQSRSQSAKGYRQEINIRKQNKTQADDIHKRKCSNMSDLSLIHRGYDDEFRMNVKHKEETTHKKSLHRSRSKSTKNINPKSSRKSIDKIKTRQQQKCLSQIDKIRALREIVQIQKNIRIHLQNSTINCLTDEDSLITIQDFSSSKVESGQIMELIEEIGSNIEDQQLPLKLKKLTQMAQQYFKKQKKEQQQGNLVNQKIKNPISPQFEIYNQKQETSVLSKQGSFSIPFQQKQENCQKLTLQQNKIGEFRLKELEQLPTYRPQRSKLASFEMVVSPKSYSRDIDQLLNQKSMVTHHKYQKKMQLLYKLYENQLYSPRTFQSKLQFLDSVQMKQYEEFKKQIESANKIKSLIKSMREDQEQIAQLEMVYKEQKWEEAIDLMKGSKEEQKQQKPRETNHVDKFFLSKNQRQLSTSPVQNQEKKRINEIFQNFQKISPNFDEQKEEYRKMIEEGEFQESMRYNTKQDSQGNNIQYSNFSDIGAIRQYCVNVFKFIMDSPELQNQFLKNLLLPIEHDFCDFLRVYNKDISKGPNSQMDYYRWKQTVFNNRVISESTIESILENIQFNPGDISEHSIIHQKMILQALNNSLNYERFSSKKMVLPWDVHLRNLSQQGNILKNIYLKNQGCLQEEVEQIYIKSVQRLIGWAKHYCGIFLQSVPGKQRMRQGIPEDQSQCQQQILRQVRMALMLHNCLIEYDEDIKNIGDTVVEVKLRLQKEVMEQIIEQMADEVILFMKK